MQFWRCLPYVLSFPCSPAIHVKLIRPCKNDNGLHLTKMLTAKWLKARMFQSHEPEIRSVRGGFRRPPPVEERSTYHSPGAVLSGAHRSGGTARRDRDTRRIAPAALVIGHFCRFRSGPEFRGQPFA